MADKDTSKATSASTSTAASSTSKASSRGPASESGDPAVHQLLAELETARSNDDADGVKAAQKALADLGFEAG